MQFVTVIPLAGVEIAKNKDKTQVHVLLFVIENLFVLSLENFIVIINTYG